MDGTERVLTVKQPWADLIIAGAKTVENRTWAVPSTMPEWMTCTACYAEREPGEELTDDCGCVTDDIPKFGGEWVPTSSLPDASGPNVGRFPFRIWLHASARVTRQDYNRALVAVRGNAEASEWVRGWRANRDQVTGAVIGSVEVTGCHHADECREHRGRFSAVNQHAFRERIDFCSPWAEPGVFHWTLADPQALETPVPARGQLGLWTPDVPVERQLQVATVRTPAAAGR